MDLASIDALLEHDAADDDNAGKPSTRVVVTRRRWWIIAQYATFAFLQGWYWAIPGTISDSYTATYGVDSFTIQVIH